ncbi:MAG: hypothetical protein PVI40_07805 [Chlamydiota bacterium]|jgi:hypothetical protein
MQVKLKLGLSFLFAILLHFWQTALFPHFHVHSFLPFLALSFLLKDRPTSLWMCIGSGVIVDCFTYTKMGIWPLNFCLLNLTCYSLKTYFYADKPLHLGIYTAILSFVSSLFHVIFLFLFDRSLSFSGKWVVIDFGFMPLMDGVYAIIWLSVFLGAVDQVIKKWKAKAK